VGDAVSHDDTFFFDADMMTLESLEICDSDERTELSEILGGLTSLWSPKLHGCSAIRRLPESLGELFKGGSAWFEPSIWSRRLLQLGSLERLTIHHCLGIKSVPEDIKGVTALKELHICRCPD
jgi:hypothetical protein